MADEVVNGGGGAPDSGAAPAPAETSTPEPAPSAGAEFSGLGTDFDDVEVEIALPEAGGVEPPKPAEGAPKPLEAEPPKPAPAPTPPPVAPAAAPPAAGPKETPPAAASLPSEPRTLVEQLGQHRTEIMDELAKTRFAWNAGEQKAFTDALEADASQALVDWVPKLMSRMYYESATMALNHINQFVPVLMANYTKLMDQQKEAEKSFFGQFPQLSKEKHWNDILQFANVFGKQQGITQADLLAMVGAAVMAKNRLNLGAPQANGGAPPRKPSTPAFVPAQAGGSPARVVTEPESPYAGLGGTYDDE
jgi:hypothetical protein